MSVNSEEWGDWQDHNGGPQPVSDKTIVAVEFRDYPDDLQEWNADPDHAPACAWVWRHDGRDDDIIRYRILRPKALQRLIKMVENLPAHKSTYEEA